MNPTLAGSHLGTVDALISEMKEALGITFARH